VLVDYKTDAIPDGQEGLIQERYGLQISCYAKALTLLTGKTVKERVVYLFAKDRTVSL
jgi:ATP-dependent helicase/nuclease subunit A